MTSPNLTPPAPLAAADARTKPSRSRRGVWLSLGVVAVVGVVAATQLGPWSARGTGNAVPPGDTSGAPSAAPTPIVPPALVGDSDTTRADTARREATGRATKPAATPATTTGDTPAASPPEVPNARRNTRLPIGGSKVSKALERLDERNQQRVAAGKDPIELAIGWIKIGSRIPLATLYVNEQPPAVIGGRGPRLVTVRAGQVRVSLRAEGCASWDTTLTVATRDTAIIGFRAPRCP